MIQSLIRHPFLWLAGFAIWAATLWWLSSAPRDFPAGPEFAGRDKVLHFGYFFGGGFMFAAFLFRRRALTPGNESVNWDRIILLAILAAGLTGVIDEWHQTKVPGRSGNDAADLTADLVGAACGAIALRYSRRWLT